MKIDVMPHTAEFPTKDDHVAPGLQSLALHQAPPASPQLRSDPAPDRRDDLETGPSVARCHAADRQCESSRPAGGDQPDTVIVGIRDCDLSVCRLYDPARRRERGRARWTAVAEWSPNAAGDGADGPAAIHPPDASIAGVGDKEAALRGRRDSQGTPELGERGRATVARGARVPVARDSVDVSLIVDLTYSIVLAVGHEDCSVGEQCYVGGCRECRRCRGASVPGRSVRTGARDRFDRAAPTDDPNAMIAGVGY
jgi:hypothetical protein